MAKTLVALYDTLTDAEQVVHELIDEGFARSDIHLALDHTRSGVAHASSGGGDAAYEEAHLTETLVDLGVPYDEVQAYREGVRRGGALVVVESSDAQAERGMAILRGLHPVDIHARATQWRQEGWTGDDATVRQSTPEATASATAPSAQVRVRSTSTTPGRGTGAPTRRSEGHEEVAIPVVQEDLSIGKREVEHGHVRIASRVTEQPVEEAVRLREEKVTVERRPANRPATEADFAAAAQEVLELTETAEEAVVTKRARVVEEVVVHTEVTEHTETVRETVRRTDVDVQREPETATERRRSTAPKDFAAYDAVFRQHYTTALADRGTAYIEYEPAYRYGYTLATDERYGGRDWAALEADARRDWEARHPSTWERFQDAIRYGWESLTGQGAEGTHGARTMDRADFTTYGDDFHTHYVTAFGERGAAYTEYEPAYRYGYDLGTNERYRGRAWAAVEADARREWDARHPSTWDRFQDAIRYGWDTVRART